MTSKKELQTAYCLAAILLVLGLLSYAAFPAKTPDPPVRIMFQGVAGKVLFDHKLHFTGTEIGLDCIDCHHHYEEDADRFRSCGDCHLTAEAEMPPQACLDCHDESEIDAEENPKRTDALHQQCGGCHEDFGAGPGTSACASCHVL
jgi:Zn finger protein HypA/HybF involved in hydrogenase expression